MVAERALRRGATAQVPIQHWALSLIDARPLKEGDGKDADRGMDGLLYFYESKNERRKILAQVKVGDVATLLGNVKNQKATGGILLTLKSPLRRCA